MEKIFALFATEDEIELVEKTISDMGNLILDSDKSKKFNVQGHGITVYHVVCTEVTFQTLQAEIFAIRIF